MNNTVISKTLFKSVNVLRIFIICILFININVLAAKSKIIALLIIVDKYEDESSNNIAASVRNDYNTISQFLTLLENRNLYTVEKITLRGNNTKLSDVKKSLEKINSKKDDIIFVYFSGHGGMDRNGTFMVCSDGKYLYRNYVESVITNKPNKFSTLITDACSNDIEGLAVMRSFHNTKDAKEGKNDAAYKKLFDDYLGFMSISASSEGEYAWSDDNLGGYFTHYFFKEALIKNPKESWLEIFEYSKKKVVQIFNSMSAEQKSQLLQEGIKSQTPKMYSVPITKSGNQVQETEIMDNAAKEAAIRIYNRTEELLTIEIDYNTDEKKWTEEKTAKKKIAPNNFIDIEKECTIFFETGIEEAGYELTTGNYEFAQVNSKEIDLFIEGDDASSDNYNSDEELLDLMTGLWEMYDGEFISEITFDENGTYTIVEDNQITESGEWALIEDDEGYINLVLSLEREDNIEFEINYSDDFSLELVPLINGKPSNIIYYLNKLEY